MEPVCYPDLGATVYRDGVPEGAADELPSLYSSLFSTLDWWETQDHKTPTGACTLDGPRHVVMFYVETDTVEILNKVFAIGPEETRRACRAIFRALPGTRRIHLEVLFPPRELRLPVRVRASGEHMVIDLPATVAEYDASLGKRTRGNLRNFQNRLRRDHPDVRTTVSVPGDAADELFTQFLEWKMAWFHSRGRVTFWEDLPYQVDMVRALVRRRAEAHVTTIDGDMAAIRFMFPVGATTVALQGSFDPRYHVYRLGLLSSYWAVCDAVTRELKQVNLLWGTTDYKSHLGATPRTATQVSIFRSRGARLYSLGEAREIAMRGARHRGKALYWDTRHRVRRAVERVKALVGAKRDVT